MNIMTYSQVRSQLAATIKKVCRDHAPVTITRKREDTVVMMSLEDYESLNDTHYLLRSPAHARRLLQSIKQLAAGKRKERKLAQ